MPKPLNKQELIVLGNKKFNDLFELLNSMNETDKNSLFEPEIEKMGNEAHWKRDKNVRDVLIHLYEWHCLLINWVNRNNNGQAESFLPPPYNWKTYGEMNIAFWHKHQNTSLVDAIKMLKESHEQVVNLIDFFSYEEIFVKNVLAWTKGSTLAQYFTSTTSSHYDFAIKKIKKANSLTKA